jgi:hypothetical protein
MEMDSYMEMDCRKEGVRRTIRPFAFFSSQTTAPLQPLQLYFENSHHLLKENIQHIERLVRDVLAQQV